MVVIVQPDGTVAVVFLFPVAFAPENEHGPCVFDSVASASSSSVNGAQQVAGLDAEPPAVYEKSVEPSGIGFLTIVSFASFVFSNVQVTSAPGTSPTERL